MWVLFVILIHWKTQQFAPPVQVGGFVSEQACMEYGQQQIEDFINPKYRAIYTCINPAEPVN